MPGNSILYNISPWFILKRQINQKLTFVPATTWWFEQRRIQYTDKHMRPEASTNWLYISMLNSDRRLHRETYRSFHEIYLPAFDCRSWYLVFPLLAFLNKWFITPNRTVRLCRTFYSVARGRIWLCVVSVYLPGVIFVTGSEKVLICCGQWG